MAGTATAAATAEAATLTIAPVKPCYLAGDEIVVTGTGFTPAGTVNVSFDGGLIGPVVASPAGAIGVGIRLGGMKAVKPHTLTATDAANPALTASAGFTGTTLHVTVRPRNAAPGKKRKLQGYGFLAGPRVYMHVRGPGGFKTDRKIATPAASCGTFATRKRIVPANARPGRYRVQFDAKKRFSKKTKPRVRGTLTVYRGAAGPARASAFAGAAPISWTTAG